MQNVVDCTNHNLSKLGIFDKIFVGYIGKAITLFQTGLLVSPTYTSCHGAVHNDISIRITILLNT